MKTKIFVDGSFFENNARLGCVIYSFDTQKFIRTTRIQCKSSIEAEYNYILFAIDCFRQLLPLKLKKKPGVMIFSDCLMVVKQLNGKAKVYDSEYIQIYGKICRLLTLFKKKGINIRVEWISREDNEAHVISRI